MKWPGYLMEGPADGATTSGRAPSEAIDPRVACFSTAQRRKAIGLVVLGSCVIGLGGLVVRSIEVATPWQIVFYRGLALAAGMTVLLLFQSRGQLLAELRGADRWMLLAGVFQAGATTAFVFSLVNTTVANTLFLLSAAPFVTALLAWGFLREAVQPTTWVAMLVALVGVGIMVGNGVVIGATLGNVAAVVATVGFSCFVVTLRRGRARNMCPALIVGGGLAAAVALVSAGFNVAVPMRDVALAMFWGAILQCTAHFLFVQGSRHLLGAELTLLVQVEVVTGPLWVWVAFGEEPAAWTIVGGVVVLMAVAGRALMSLRWAGGR